ncbi:DNA polymerase III subunit chi [Haliea sp. AH-315-K21]|uniref:DNA polymerase III subunit chi n=1 Tax=SAR86 cluster bacterium TaxID=2030880 RepID=A0A2A5CBF5_9GAMM|nr:DNA polymerase III subunit chi [Haliea sp. AH-315-K21]MBN4075983.1 DNA polymerase III subunit chi [Gammaproteobacteria bacterium AH-315-E17]PCJ41214.1 MAG: DNA polymerase III subunit chi [SAR86 cluster bacterium]
MSKMPKVNFYLLKHGQSSEQYTFACRLCEKILSQKLKAYIHTDTQEQAQYLDDLLWSYRPESFLPHCVIGTDLDEDVSIIIGYADKYQKKFDVLINLSQDIPDFHTSFSRIVEIIPADEEAKALGRVRWKHYKDASYELETHDA